MQMEMRQVTDSEFDNLPLYMRGWWVVVIMGDDEDDLIAVFKNINDAEAFINAISK
mgnify:FL=1